MGLVLFGCKSGEKHDTVLDGPIETVTPRKDSQNAKNSLDWAGVYEGTTPCKDCDGIQTRVELRKDNSFEITQTHLGKEGDGQSFKGNGTFEWEDDSKVVLETSELRIKFEVEEGQITLLDMSGNVATKKLGNFYILKKK